LGSRNRPKAEILRIWRSRARVPEDPQLAFLFMLE
jgi:hypothetical protein